MNELPNELMCLIFNHLGLIDLFDNCRLVCKRWKELVDSIKFQHLILSDFNDHFKTYWFPLKPIDPNHIIYFHHPTKSNFPSNKIKNNFIKLKYLKFDFHCGFDLDLNDLNKFSNLEHLEIRMDNIDLINSSLKLPNLKSFNLEVYKKFNKIQIDTPKLVTVVCNNLSSMEFVHPESIEFLKETDRKVLNDQYSDLIKFKNLKEYRIEFGITRKITDLLSKLPIGLQCFHLNFWGIRHTVWSFNGYKYLINFILNYKIEKKRTNLKIYLDEIELNKSAEEYRFGFKNRWELYHANYDQLKTLPNVDYINYNELIELFNNEIPNDFCNKFNTIQTVFIKEGVNENQLIGFLKGCSYLKCLIFSRCLFNQNFYNQLLRTTNSLISLYIFENKKIEIDFKFLIKFKSLFRFETDQQIPIQSAKYLIKNVNHLIDFRFWNNGKTLSYSKNPKTVKIEILGGVSKIENCDEFDQWCSKRNDLI